MTLRGFNILSADSRFSKAILFFKASLIPTLNWVNIEAYTGVGLFLTLNWLLSVTALGCFFVRGSLSIGPCKPWFDTPVLKEVRVV